MKANLLKQTLAEGRVPVGHMILEFGTRGIAQVMAAAGVDFVIIDTEHTGFTPSQIADLLAWFKATEVAPLVRIPQIQYHFISRTLDTGALGIMVPNVKNGAEARAVVSAAKYAPLGQRGIIFGQAQNDFKAVNPAEFMNYANTNTTIICQIESVEGVENLEEIATTPGVDILWVGQFDLSQSMGIPGQFDHPRFLEAIQRVIEVGRSHGLGLGIQPGSLAQAQGWLELGFNVISYSADLFLYLAAMTQAVAEVRRLAGE
jgi:2-dehydro-3-deoxyglucarate aldolase/4-hydroxy-2-oxoheptanedioate aldolase